MGKRLWFFLTCLMVSASMAFAQKQVTGIVTDIATGEPLVGVHVKVNGQALGVTDVNGKFTLNNVPESAKVIEFSYMGYEDAMSAVKSLVRVAMAQENQKLDDVLVVGFGVAKKSAFTGSAKVVSADDLAKSQVSSITDALQGAVPGLQLTQSNGAPGGTSTIRIRGFSSITAGKDPLIIVDGAPYSGDISNINPNDVENVTVLKDAASNALYGARGANGVIMITTKQGNVLKPATVTFDAKWGANTRAVQHYDTYNDPAKHFELQYAALNNYYLNSGMSETAAWQAANKTLVSNAAGGLGYNIWTYPETQALIGLSGKMNPNATLGRVVSYKGEDYLLTPDDWEDLIGRTGVRQEYNMSVTGATEKSNLYFSLGYLKNEGITYNSDHERYTGRLRADYQAKSWMKIGANVAYAHFDWNSLENNGSDTSTGNIWAFGEQMAPVFPMYHRNADGTIMRDANGFKIRDYGEGKNGGATRPFIYNANPLQDNLLNTKHDEGNASTGNIFTDITFMPGLVLTLNATYNLDETRTNYVYNPYYGQFTSTGGTVSVYHTRSYDYNLQQLMNYTTTLQGHHNLNVMLGHEYYKNIYTYLGASKSKMFSQDNKELNGAVVDGQSSSSYRSFYNNEGYFGRVRYDFDEKYFASASYRRDASSRFHPDYRWGSFWSLGAAWLINKEDWFDIDWVNELKFKASYGSQGNDNIGSYLYTDRYDIVPSDGNIGTSFAGKGTKNITWETNSNFNVGFDFQLLNRRLVGSLEFYHRKTTDMLFSFSVAPSLGYSSYYDNVGDLYNQGVELDLSYDIIRKRDFNWNAHLNVSTLRNKVTMLHPDKKNATYFDKDGKPYDGYVSGSWFITEGNSMYSWRLKDFAGVDKKTGESMWWKNVYKQVQSIDEAGNLLWELDKNGNPALDNDGNKIPVMEDYVDAKGHKVVEGREATTDFSKAEYYVTNESTIPKVFGGFGTSLNFKGFDFSINCSYSIGGKSLDYTYMSLMSSPTSSSNGYRYHKDIKDSWTATNNGSDVPRFQYEDIYSAASSTRFLTNASYLNIENINVGYTLPKKITRAAMIESLRIYMAAENVGYFSARKGFDARQAYSDGATSSRYSPMRTISGGISLTF